MIIAYYKYNLADLNTQHTIFVNRVLLSFSEPFQEFEYPSYSVDPRLLMHIPVLAL